METKIPQKLVIFLGIYIAIVVALNIFASIQSQTLEIWRVVSSLFFCGIAYLFAKSNYNLALDRGKNGIAPFILGLLLSFLGFIIYRIYVSIIKTVDLNKK